MRNSEEVLIVLGGGLIKTGAGTWRTLELQDDGDSFGASTDRWRAIAASYLYEEAPRIVIASGGRGQYRSVADAPSVSAVIKEELIALGVTSEDILEEAQSGSTYEQLSTLSRMDIISKSHKAFLITNEWHAPRVSAMLRFMLPGKFTNATVLSAEEVLTRTHPELWDIPVSEARSSDKIRARVAVEKQGVEDIQRGTYELTRYD